MFGSYEALAAADAQRQWLAANRARAVQALLSEAIDRHEGAIIAMLDGDRIVVGCKTRVPKVQRKTA